MAVLSDFERINNILTTLHETFGARKDLAPETVQRLRNIFENCKKTKKFSDFIREVKLLFNLPMGFRIQYKYDKIIYDQPEAVRNLVMQLCPFSMGWAARVIMPEYLPPFGSSALKNYDITIEIKKSLQYEKFESFFFCISHEMSHVLLRAVKPELWLNEEANDLLPLVMGFSEIAKEGRNSLTGIPYGYLDDELFLFACQRIKEMQKANSFVKRGIEKIKDIFSF